MTYPPFKTIWERVQYVTKLTCQSCGCTQNYYHQGCPTKRDAEKDMPTEHWNGWDMENEICYTCKKLKEAED